MRSAPWASNASFRGAEPVVDTSHNSVIFGPANMFALDTDLGGAVALPTMRPRPSGIHQMLLEVLSVKTCGYVMRSSSRRSPPSTGITMTRSRPDAMSRSRMVPFWR